MTNPITEARNDVMDALKSIDNLRVFAYQPEALTVPAATIRPGSPYVVPGSAGTNNLPYGQRVITLYVRLWLNSGSNQSMSESMDDLIDKVCDALSPIGFTTVDQPGTDSETYGSESPYYVTDVTVQTIYGKDGL